MSNTDAPTPPDAEPNPDGVTPAPYAPTDPYAAPVPVADAAPPVAGLPTAPWPSAPSGAPYPGMGVPAAPDGFPQDPGAYPPPVGGAYPTAGPLPIGSAGTYPGLVPARRTDGVSIGALVTGLLGLGFLPFVLGIVGLRRTRTNGTGGRGMAIAGIILGALSFVGWIIIVFVGGILAQDHRINGLHEACAAGEMASCDDLYHNTPAGSDERTFGDTCGGRTIGGTYCKGMDPTRNAYGDDADLDALWDACESGDDEACDDLSSAAPYGSDYRDFAMTCGGRTAAGGMCELGSIIAGAGAGVGADGDS